MIDALDQQLAPLERKIREVARSQAGCRALQRHFGIGTAMAPTILVELGDVSRLRRSRQAVRVAGLDVGVERSDRRSRPGKLTKQGSAHLRWALYEAAQSACRKTSPDHGDYLRLRERGLTHTRASLTIAPKARAPLLPLASRVGARGARGTGMRTPLTRRPGLGAGAT